LLRVAQRMQPKNTITMTGTTTNGEAMSMVVKSLTIQIIRERIGVRGCHACESERF
jgi:hypothetical protein